MISSPFSVNNEFLNLLWLQRKNPSQEKQRKSKGRTTQPTSSSKTMHNSQTQEDQGRYWDNQREQTEKKGKSWGCSRVGLSIAKGKTWESTFQWLTQQEHSQQSLTCFGMIWSVSPPGNVDLMGKAGCISIKQSFIMLRRWLRVLPLSSIKG